MSAGSERQNNLYELKQLFFLLYEEEISGRAPQSPPVCGLPPALCSSILGCGPWGCFPKQSAWLRPPAGVCSVVGGWGERFPLLPDGPVFPLTAQCLKLSHTTMNNYRRNRESLQLGALPPRWEPVAIAATEDVGL